MEGAVIGKAIGAAAGHTGKEAFDAFMNYLAADSSFVSESEYVSTLPAPGVSSNGLPVYYPSGWSEDGGYLSMHSFSQLQGGYSFSGHAFQKVSSTSQGLPKFKSDVLYLPPGTYRVNLLSGSSLSSRPLSGSYILPSGGSNGSIASRPVPFDFIISPARAGIQFGSGHQWSILSAGTLDPDTGLWGPVYSGSASY